jgi:mercuric ion binding protein
MRNFRSCLAITALFFLVSMSFGQKQRQKEIFKVWGNCGMCKKTIEISAKVKGVYFAEWDINTHLMTIEFNPKKVSLAEVHKNIATNGYDTELETASDEVYNSLHGCCKYIRKSENP